MKSRILMVAAGLCFLLGASPRAWAATYYINDGSTNGDVYASQIGNDINPGTMTNQPKATLANLIGTTTLNPGDVVYIDTGTYAPTVVSNTVIGAAGNPVLLQQHRQITTDATRADDHYPFYFAAFVGKIVFEVDNSVMFADEEYMVVSQQGVMPFGDDHFFAAQNSDDQYRVRQS